MTRARLLAVMWLLAGVAVWSGMFDLHMARGADQYLWRVSEYRLHLISEEPSMARMMAAARRNGAVMSGIWAAVITGAGWLTIWLLRPRPRP